MENLQSFTEIKTSQPSTNRVYLNMNDPKYEIQTTFIPGRKFDSSNLQPMYDKLYATWKRIWLEVFGNVGKANEIHPDDFFRADVFNCIEVNGEVAALHLYTFFDLDFQFVQEHSYLKGIPKDIFQEFKNTGHKKVMSLEYLTIDPKWRRSLTGLPLKEALIGCGANFLACTSSTASFGTGRVDVKIDQLGHQFGAYAIGHTIKKYDYDCILLVMDRDQIHPHKDIDINSFTQRLWDQRKDYTGLTNNYEKQTRLKVA